MAPKENVTATATRAKLVSKAMKNGLPVRHRKIRFSLDVPDNNATAPRRQPLAPRRLLPKVNRLQDEFRVIQTPLTTEAALKQVESNNTLVFLCDPRATKTIIKAAFFKRYAIKPVKVNTLIRPDGKKKAFIRLPKETDALDIANRMGML